MMLDLDLASMTREPLARPLFGSISAEVRLVMMRLVEVEESSV